jgi:hypothetical protein
MHSLRLADTFPPQAAVTAMPHAAQIFISLISLASTGRPGYFVCPHPQAGRGTIDEEVSTPTPSSEHDFVAPSIHGLHSQSATGSHLAILSKSKNQ